MSTQRYIAALALALVTLWYTPGNSSNLDCEGYLSGPAMELAHGIPQDAMPWPEMHPLPMVRLAVDVSDPQDFAKVLRHFRVPILKNVMLTNLVVGRSGAPLGHLAYVGAKSVLLQPKITMGPQAVAQIMASQNGLAIPVVGVIPAAGGGWRLVRPLTAGAGLWPAEQLEFRLSFQLIVDFEERLQKIVKDWPSTTRLGFVIRPESERALSRAEGLAIARSLKFVFAKDGKPYLEEFNTADLEALPNKVVEVLDIKSGMGAYDWDTWVRTLFLRSLGISGSDFYRSFLWQHFPKQIHDLDTLNADLMELGRAAFGHFNFMQIYQLLRVKHEIHLDHVDAYPRPTQLRFADNKKLKYHFKKHGGEVAARDASSYAAQAVAFIQGTSAHKIYILKGEDYIVYDSVSETFAVFTQAGVIKTYFKPDPKFHNLGENAIYPLAALYEAWDQLHGFEFIR